MHKNYNENIQIRLLNKIIEKSRRIQFHPKEHKYFLDTFELTSVTTQIDTYRSEFQSNKIASSLHLILVITSALNLKNSC